jgi:hypothetical protein
MMINNNVFLLESISEAKKGQHTNLIFNVIELSATIAMNLSNVENCTST